MTPQDRILRESTHTRSDILASTLRQYHADESGLCLTCGNPDCPSSIPVESLTPLEKEIRAAEAHYHTIADGFMQGSASLGELDQAKRELSKPRTL